MGLHFILLLCIPRLKGFLVNDVHGNSLLTTALVFHKHILYTSQHHEPPHNTDTIHVAVGWTDMIHWLLR